MSWTRLDLPHPAPALPDMPHTSRVPHLLRPMNTVRMWEVPCSRRSVKALQGEGEGEERGGEGEEEREAHRHNDIHKVWDSTQGLGHQTIELLQT